MGKGFNEGNEQSDQDNMINLVRAILAWISTPKFDYGLRGYHTTREP